MRVVVAGGTGFIGRAVVSRLLGAGHTVAVTTRDPMGPDPWQGAVERLQAFAGDLPSLSRAFTLADVVVLAIQFPNHPVENARKGHTYLEVDGRGTEVAAEAARKAGVRRLVYISGAGAGRGRPEPWFAAKDRAEAAIRASGLEHALLRPSLVYGPGDRSMARLIWMCRHLPVVPVVGDGGNPLYPLHVADLAACVLQTVERADACALTLEQGGERLTMDEVLRTIQGVLGRRRPLLHHPAPLMKVLSLPLVLLPRPPLSPGAVDFVTMDVEIDTGPARAYFGFTPRSLEQGLREWLGRGDG
jgi:nucleoside-diphosphate-sugar epimerase